MGSSRASGSRTSRSSRAGPVRPIPKGRPTSQRRILHTTPDRGTREQPCPPFARKPVFSSPCWSPSAQLALSRKPRRTPRLVHHRPPRHLRRRAVSASAPSSPAPRQPGPRSPFPRTGQSHRTDGFTDLSSPEGDLYLVVADVGPATDARAAIATAWARYTPGVAQLPKIVTPQSTGSRKRPRQAASETEWALPGKRSDS